MIFYFSGTGNSLWAAKELKRHFTGDLISIADELNMENNTFRYAVEADEAIFFVFPVHSWGAAILVLEFIKRLVVHNYHSQNIYAIGTCGDNCGNTSSMLAKALHKRGLHLSKTYSIAMPNNYILMKGFGLDPKPLEEQKLQMALPRLNDIVTDIQTKGDKNLYEKGKYARLKSGLIYPIFKTFAVKHPSFYATDACISCGLCVRICPVKTISLSGGKPVWSKRCVQCCGCIHRCPTRAIEWGNITLDQGRYLHPDLKRES
ncbi:MAG: EFR1 family ferrodoxin [Bacteroidales bacterium]|jgi:ferredoxin|nr:EFR1 family ferrodoxin [Bacteroidales bacterium]